MQLVVHRLVHRKYQVENCHLCNHYKKTHNLYALAIGVAIHPIPPFLHQCLLMQWYIHTLYTLIEAIASTYISKL